VDFLVAVVLARSLGVWAIVAGTLSGALTAMLVSYVVAPHVPRLSFRFRELLPLIRYGRWILFTGIVALLGTTLLQMMISRTLGAAALGVYFLASKVSFMPSTAANAVVGAVAFPIFAQLHAAGERTSAAFRQLLAGLLLVLIPLYAMVFVLAPALEMVLGARWAATAPVIRILAIACVTGVFGQLLVQLMFGQGRSDAAFRLELFQTGTLAVLAWPLIGVFGVAGAAVAWLIGNLAAAIAGLYWLRTRVQLREAVDLGLTACAAAAAAVAGVAAARIWQAWPGMAGLFAAGICGVASAVSIVLLLARVFNLRLDPVIGWLRARTDHGSA
jgi:O-antigen/teichoic acid export membrane protein